MKTCSLAYLNRVYILKMFKINISCQRKKEIQKKSKLNIYCYRKKEIQKMFKLNIYC